MPTLTFYATDEVVEQLDKVIKRRSKLSGISVSRGDILVPYIKSLYRAEFPKNGKAHIVGQAQATPIITGEIAGMVKSEQSASAQEVKA